MELPQCMFFFGFYDKMCELVGIFAQQIHMRRQDRGCRMAEPHGALGFKDGTCHHSQTSPTGTVCMVWYREAKTFFRSWCIIRHLLQLGVRFNE